MNFEIRTVEKDGQTYFQIWDNNTSYGSLLDLAQFKLFVQEAVNFLSEYNRKSELERLSIKTA